MSYYETLKPGPDTDIGKLSASAKNLSEQIPRIKKRLADEQNNSERLKTRIQELESRAGEVLTDDKNAYEKYRTSLKKLNSELETSTSMIQSLSETLSSKQRELREGREKLKYTLNAYLLKNRPTADERINGLLKECIYVRQDFIDSFKKIYADCGNVDFFFYDESYCPGPWSGSKVRDMCVSLGIGISRTGDIIIPKPVQTTPEAGSQAVESQPPQLKVGTKAGVTLLT
jgi:chaperonin cofactor prefoldin